jgi:tagatose 1,6-diphosphate aldolase
VGAAVGRRGIRYVQEASRDGEKAGQRRLGGRAFWKEFFTYPTPADRQKFAEGECVRRVKETDAIVKTGTPWFAKYGLSLGELHEVRATEGWHARYGGGTASGPAGKVDPNAVY